MKASGDLTHRRRRGAALVVALLCLVILVGISGSLARLSLSRRAARLREERRSQAEWLARSGVERAVVKLDRDKAYRGETWNVSPEELAGHEGGRVTISLEGSGEKPDGRRLRVVADYPIEESRRVRRTLIIPLEPGGDASVEEK